MPAAAAFSGGAVSPARALGPAIVFHCHWNKVWVYVLGEIAGCIVAGLLACPLYGGHAKYLDPMIRASRFVGYKLSHMRARATMRDLLLHYYSTIRMQSQSPQAAG